MVLWCFLGAGEVSVTWMESDGQGSFLSRQLNFPNPCILCGFEMLSRGLPPDLF